MLLNSDDADLTELLYEFANNQMEKILPRAGEQLVRILDRQIRNIPNIAIKQDCPIPRIPSTFNRMRFIELDALEMARQLTLMYSVAFEKTRPHNLLFPDVSVKRDLWALNSLDHQVIIIILIHRFLLGCLIRFFWNVI